MGRARRRACFGRVRSRIAVIPMSGSTETASDRSWQPAHCRAIEAGRAPPRVRRQGCSSRLMPPRAQLRSTTSIEAVFRRRKPPAFRPAFRGNGSAGCRAASATALGFEAVHGNSSGCSPQGPHRRRLPRASRTIEAGCCRERSGAQRPCPPPVERSCFELQLAARAWPIIKAG